MNILRQHTLCGQTLSLKLPYTYIEKEEKIPEHVQAFSDENGNFFVIQYREGSAFNPTDENRKIYGWMRKQYKTVSDPIYKSRIWNNIKQSMLSFRMNEHYEHIFVTFGTDEIQYWIMFCNVDNQIVQWNKDVNYILNSIKLIEKRGETND